jgi:hypothetical protein
MKDRQIDRGIDKLRERDNKNIVVAEGERAIQRKTERETN